MLRIFTWIIHVYPGVILGIILENIGVGFKVGKCTGT